ncbi:MAG: enolase C-terminal domain-like protein [Actinomycetota bacterium]
MAEQLTESDSAALATIRLVRLPTLASLAAAHDPNPQSHRELVYVALHPEDDASLTVGWGECSALNAPTYTREWASGAFESLTSTSGPTTNEPMARAAIEMAQLDAELRRDGISLAERLGTSGHSAPAGAVVGLDTIPNMLDQVAELAMAGYRRVKIKIVPGRVVEPIRAVRRTFPDLELQVDANSSLSIDDLGLLLALRDLGVSAVEQPFAVGDHRAAARLVSESDLVVLADEAVDDLSDLHALAADQAATGVVVKPPRAGGLRPALAMVDAAVSTGMACSVGGMLESGLGRHQLAAMAPLEPFRVTGDLSPARRWLAEDPFADIEVVDGRVPAPSTPGIAGDPDLDLLDHHTVAAATVWLPK